MINKLQFSIELHRIISFYERDKNHDSTCTIISIIYIIP
jgi:hypothetical protein